jgi:hypothetical protein
LATAIKYDKNEIQKFSDAQEVKEWIKKKIRKQIHSELTIMNLRIQTACVLTIRYI